MFNASSGAALCERYMGSETRLLEGQWQRSDLRQQNSMPWPQRSVKPERLALVPDLCLVAGGAGVCSRLDRVEDRFLFVQVFAVNLILNQHYPARLSLITVSRKSIVRRLVGFFDGKHTLLPVRGRFGRVLTRPHNRHCGPEKN
jgi:hypothetical protein